MKGSQSEQEPEVELPLSDPCWEGSRELPQVAADVQWSHLMMGKATIRRQISGRFRVWHEQEKDKQRTVMQIALLKR